MVLHYNMGVVGVVVQGLVCVCVCVFTAWEKALEIKLDFS